MENQVLIGKSHNYMENGRVTTEVLKDFNEKMGPIVIIKQIYYQKNIKIECNEYVSLRPAEVMIFELNQIDGIIDMLMSASEVK